MRLGIHRATKPKYYFISTACSCDLPPSRYRLKHPRSPPPFNHPTVIHSDPNLTAADLGPALDRLWNIAGDKIHRLARDYDTSKGSPVFTVRGKYSTRGWTEWTQGFQYGSAILHFDATGEDSSLQLGRDSTVKYMAPHVSHIGVHDHGFNNVSTYGNLLRLMGEGRIPEDRFEREFYTIALQVSGAVQASRWTPLPEGGFIHSFNGPHSLFVDTIRSCRALMVSHLLGHRLMTENDRAINLLGRALEHIRATARYSVFYGDGRDSYDIRGRTAHESVFNVTDGNFRCPNSQQGYTGFTTWTRGLAWAMVGFAEELELLDTLADEELVPFGGRAGVEAILRRAAEATCDFYLEHTPTDGVPYWDTGAPGLVHMGDYLKRPADPFNDHEPVDSSAAAIGAQGLLRLARWLEKRSETAKTATYWQAGLTVMRTLLDEPYLATDPEHQGILLHTIYHQPNGWDHVPTGSKIACGESCMWGDYHLLEAALYLDRIRKDQPYYTFFAKIG